MGEVDQLARALDIVASRCPRGLAAIVGDAPQPSDAEIVAAATWRPAAEGEEARRRGSMEGSVLSLAER